MVDNIKDLIDFLNWNNLDIKDVRTEKIDDNIINLEICIEGDYEKAHLECKDLVRDFCEEHNVKIKKFSGEIINIEKEFDDDYYEGCMHWCLDFSNYDNDVQLTETYSKEELDKLVGKTFNQRKLLSYYKYQGKLLAKTKCTKCGGEKTVYLSNLVKDPEKYGSCNCSNKKINSLIQYTKDLYNNHKQLSSNTSGTTGVSFIANRNGKTYNK